jgi:hypothetical protein
MRGFSYASFESDVDDPGFDRTGFVSRPGVVESRTTTACASLTWASWPAGHVGASSGQPGLTTARRFTKLLAAHLGPLEGLEVVEEGWPAYDLVNVQVALDVWLESEGARTS